MEQKSNKDILDKTILKRFGFFKRGKSLERWFEKVQFSYFNSCFQFFICVYVECNTLNFSMPSLSIFVSVPAFSPSLPCNCRKSRCAYRKNQTKFNYKSTLQEYRKAWQYTLEGIVPPTTGDRRKSYIPSYIE